jgi:hypothetical protein
VQDVLADQEFAVGSHSTWLVARLRSAAALVA